MPLISADSWDEFIANFQNAHFLQASAWGRLKLGFGWKPYYSQAGKAGAQILMRHIPLGFNIAYLPKGPLGYDRDQLWDEIDTLCRQNKTIFIKIEPDTNEPTDSKLILELNKLGRLSSTIQPRRTMVVDLNGSENELLQRMKQKTRYNIGLAQRKGINVTLTGNVDAFYNMMIITGKRDRFGIHQREYYQNAYQLFSQKGQCVLLQADYNGKPLAAIMVFTQGKRAWYLYGASTDEERNRMPTYLLQWEAMRWSKNHGCSLYDLWGVPDASEDQLEADFIDRSDGLWGVYRFKRGFGAQLVRSAGAWDRVYNPALYRLYRLYTRSKSPDAI
jgi:peptidoglycan pentaglycine glycine transferase (the first glycine)